MIEEEQRKKLQQSIVQTSEKIEKDQEIINELNRTKQELKTMKNLEFDIRDCFNIDEKEDLGQKMIVIREDLEMKILLEKELEKLQNQLREA
jgi:hypothetical protein